MKRPPAAPLRQRKRQHGVRLPDDLARQISDIARREQNPESAVIRRLLSLGLQQVRERERGAAR